jgi:hypothetical protein
MMINLCAPVTYGYSRGFHDKARNEYGPARTGQNRTCQGSIQTHDPDQRNTGLKSKLLRLASTAGLFLCPRHQLTMDFGESFGEFLDGDGGRTEKLERWEAGEAEVRAVCRLQS